MKSAITLTIILTACVPLNSEFTWVGIDTDPNSRSCDFEPRVDSGGQCIAAARLYHCVVDKPGRTVRCIQPTYNCTTITNVETVCPEKK